MAKYRIVEVSVGDAPYKWEVQKASWYGWLYYTTHFSLFDAEDQVSFLLRPPTPYSKKVIKEYG